VTVVVVSQSWTDVQSTEKAVADHLKITIRVSSMALQGVVIAGYVVTAALLAWMVVKIAEGKKWARASLALNFVVDVILTGIPRITAPPAISWR
jgi:hypothetical protein